VSIAIERTPNPDAMKFAPDARLTDGQARSFSRTDFVAHQSPLAARLFAIADVSAVFIAEDFVTVTRDAGGRPWAKLQPEALAAIADHLASGAAALAAEATTPQPAPVSEEEVEAEIRDVLGRWIRPGVARDGGDILFDRFDNQTGVLWIRMQGACGGCPSSRLTLKATVERLVRRYVPEVLRVEEVGAGAEPGRPSPLAAWLKGRPVPDGSGTRPVFTHRGREVRRAGTQS
jgi:Fe-S cluster biogenesis protein NfuA